MTANDHLATMSANNRDYGFSSPQPKHLILSHKSYASHMYTFILIKIYKYIRQYFGFGIIRIPVPMASMTNQTDLVNFTDSSIEMQTHTHTHIEYTLNRPKLMNGLISGFIIT